MINKNRIGRRLGLCFPSNSVKIYCSLDCNACKKLINFNEPGSRSLDQYHYLYEFNEIIQ